VAAAAAAVAGYLSHQQQQAGEEAEGGVLLLEGLQVEAASLRCGRGKAALEGRTQGQAPGGEGTCLASRTARKDAWYQSVISHRVCVCARACMRACVHICCAAMRWA
jgi:hypothetical protein